MMKQQQTREEREAQNTLLRAYGYHWQPLEALSNEQQTAVFYMCADEHADKMPKWVLLSPFERPVREETILRWLGKTGAFPEEVHGFLDNHGFVTMGKDSQRHWQIQTPSGNVVNQRQALQEVERIRVDRANTLERKDEQKRQQRFDLSVQTLKEALNLHGRARSNQSAWGYSPHPEAKRLADGTIEVMTYHFEGEWHTEVYQDESDVVSELFADGEYWWEAGTWR